MILSTFRVQFPEFNGVSDGMVSAYLTAASLSVDASIWGGKADQGQAYLCAHMLATTPFGQNARMVSKDGTTTYETIYKRLQLEVSGGFRVA